MFYKVHPLLFSSIIFLKLYLRNEQPLQSWDGFSACKDPSSFLKHGKVLASAHTNSHHSAGLSGLTQPLLPYLGQLEPKIWWAGRKALPFRAISSRFCLTESASLDSAFLFVSSPHPPKKKPQKQKKTLLLHPHSLKSKQNKPPKLEAGRMASSAEAVTCSITVLSSGSEGVSNHSCLHLQGSSWVLPCVLMRNILHRLVGRQ